MGSIPDQLGRYRIVRLLATGGMGEVFLARQEGPAGFSRPAVVKRVLAHLAREPDFVQMFLDEARLAGNLAHPNIVQIFELGEADGTWFIAMEYLHGRSLRLVRQQVAHMGQLMSPVQAARMLSQVLDGLQYAHSLAGPDGTQLEVVHRDISPDNAFVGFNGVVKVLDFGIAKAANAIATTRTGVVKGKSSYMGPEQLLGEKLDGRTDLYAAGVVLYELLCGERPFTGPSEAVVINLAMTTPAPSLQARAPHVPPALCAAVMKALEKDRAARWQSAGEFSNALERFVASSGEPNTNASTAAYMKELFGEVAPEDSVRQMATPVGQPVARRSELFGAVATPTDPTEVQRYPAPPSIPARPPLQSAAQDQLDALFAEQDQSPQELLELDRPPPRATPQEPEPEPQGLELDRPAREEAQQSAAPGVPAKLQAPQHATQRRWPMVAAVVAIVAAVAAAGLTARYQRSTISMTVADVLVTSDPSGANLRIGENQVGKTPWTGSNVWTGEVAWELTAPGHQKKRGTFRGGDAVRLNVKLQRK